MQDTKLNIGEYKTAAGAAKGLHSYLDEVHDASANLYSPEENPRNNGCWAVVWEGGPYEWAVHLTGGESMYCGEFGQYGMDPEVMGFYETNEWIAEPHFSFDLQFSNQ